MKTNNKYMLGIVGALVIGLFVGYQLQNNDNSTLEPSYPDQVDEHEDLNYTCSMHPQIRQNEPGLCPICEMELIPLVDNVSIDPTKLEMTEASVMLANIQTTIVGTSRASNESISLNGKIAVDESRDASLVSHLPGRIEKLSISFEGEAVNRGQRIATLYSPDLITAQRELIEAKKIQDLSPKLLDAARNKLRFWKIPEQTISQVEISETIQETFGIYAAQSGIVKTKKVSAGDYVQQGQVLFDIQNLNNLWVEFEVYESQLPSIHIGDAVIFTTAAYPEKEFNTKIIFIEPTINPSTRIAKVRAEIRNSDGKFKPEMFVTGILTNAKMNNSSEQLRVPVSSVLWTGNRSVVYTKDQSVDVPTFQYREVQLGKRLGNQYEILEGLQKGDEVVTNGAFSIDASAQLNNQSSMMNEMITVKPKFKIGESTQFKVSGNCEMCKNRIESTALNIPGVLFAKWDIETKLLQLKYDEALVTIDNVKKEIVKVGHDTDDYKSSDADYLKLASCCKYDRDL